VQKPAYRRSLKEVVDLDDLLTKRFKSEVEECAIGFSLPAGNQFQGSSRLLGRVLL
jgi:hypothetical protein